MTRSWLLHGFFFGTFFLVLYQFFSIIEPFLTPILGAMVLSILSFPLHRFVVKRVPSWDKNAQALCSTLIVISLIVGPFLILIWLLMNESQRAAPLIQELHESLQNWQAGQLQIWIDRFRDWKSNLPITISFSRADLQRYASSGATNIFAIAHKVGRTLAANLLLSIFHLIVMAVTLFFLFRDGLKLKSWILELLPMRRVDKDRIIWKLEATVTGIVRGSVLTSLFQMVCATLGYLIIGLPAAFTLGMATGVASFIPVVGSGLVWLPVGLYLVFFGSMWKGVFIIVWGTVVIAMMDNVLRAALIGHATNIPLVLLFIGLVGGIQAYGLRGLLLGPLVISILPVFLDIFQAEYMRKGKE